MTLSMGNGYPLLWPFGVFIQMSVALSLICVPEGTKTCTEETSQTTDFRAIWVKVKSAFDEDIDSIREKQQGRGPRFTCRTVDDPIRNGSDIRCLMIWGPSAAEKVDGR